MERTQKNRTHGRTRLLRCDTVAMYFPILRELPRDEQRRLFEAWLRTNPFEKSRRPPHAIKMLCLSVLLMGIVLAVLFCVFANLVEAPYEVSRWILAFFLLPVSTVLICGPICGLGFRPYREQFQTFFTEYLTSRNRSWGRL